MTAPSIPKHIPYFPKDRSVDLNLNGKIPAIDAKPGARVFHFCNELALLHHEMTRKDGKWKDGDFSTVLQSSEAPARLAQVDCAAFERRAVTDVLDCADFGDYLRDVFDALDGSGKTGCAILIHGETHDMDVTLRIKGEGRSRCYVTHFYDPNQSVTHTRFALSATGALAGHGLKYLFAGNTAGYQRYFASFSEIVAASSEDFPPSLRRRTCDIGVNPSKDKGIVLAATRYGRPDIIRRYAALPKQARMDLLHAPDDHGSTVMQWSLQLGDPDVFDALWGLLHDADPEDVRRVLCCRDRAGSPGIHMAMQLGRSEVIEPFARAISDPDLLTEIIQANAPNGTPGLFMAVQNGHAETIAACARAIQGLSHERQRDIFVARDARGIPALNFAMTRNEVSIVQAYGAAIRHLPAPMRSELLSVRIGPTYPKGGQMSPLHGAVLKGHVAAAQAWWDIARQLPAPFPQELLLQTTASGHTALELAQAFGHPDAVRFLQQCQADIGTGKRKSADDAPSSSESSKRFRPSRASTPP